MIFAANLLLEETALHKVPFRIVPRYNPFGPGVS